MTDSLRDQLLGLGFKPVARPEAPKRPDRPERDASGARRPDQRSAGQHRPGQPRPDQRRPDQRGRHDDRNPRSSGAQAGTGAPRAPDNRGADRNVQAAPGANPGRNPAPNRNRNPNPSRARAPQADIDLAKAYAIRAQREKQERIDAERIKQEAAAERRIAKARFAELVSGKALNDTAADIARHFDYGGKIKRIHVTAEQLAQLNAGALGVAQLDGRYLLLEAALMAQAQAIFPAAVALLVDPSAPAEADPYADPQFQIPDDLVW